MECVYLDRSAGSLRTAVHFRIEDALGQRLPLPALSMAEVAALVTLVAGRPADLLDLQQDRVGVAVEEDAADLLHVAALFALAPQLVAAATEVAGPPRAQRLVERFAVHPRQHQHLAGVGVLRDRRDQSAGLGKIDHRARSSVRGPGVWSTRSASRVRVWSTRSTS